jgi:DNA-binding MarR family transcriptional regulator
MKGIELLSFLTQEQKRILLNSEQNYKRFARIYFSVIQATENEIVVKVWQDENEAGKYLSAKELIDRVKEMFTGILPVNTKLHVRPIPFKEDTLEKVDVVYVEKQMEKHNLQAKDLVKLLNIDKATLSRTLSSEEMTKSSKAMFYYLFKYLEASHKTVEKVHITKQWLVNVGFYYNEELRCYLIETDQNHDYCLAIDEYFRAYQYSKLSESSLMIKVVRFEHEVNEIYHLITDKNLPNYNA